MSTEYEQQSAGDYEVPEERSLPSVSEDNRSQNQRGIVIIGLFIMVIAIAVMAFLKLTGDGGNTEEVAQPEDLQISSRLPSKTFTTPPAPPARPTPPPRVEIKVPAPVPVINRQPIVVSQRPPLPGGNQQFQTRNAEKPKRGIDKGSSGLMGSGGSGGGDASAQALKQLEQLNERVNAPQQSGFFGGDDAESAISGLGAALVSSSTDTRRASLMGDRNFILAKGSYIDCGMQTRLDSTVPGFTSCVVTRNVYSDNGKVLLIERGSTVTGEYQSNVKQGQARIFVLWNRVKTPHGVVIDLDSAGTDSLGGSGIPGFVDNHFWQRFGGALLLSLIDDLARAASTQSGSGEITFSGSGDAASDIASEALEATINIPPTLYVNQGEQVGIFVSRDLDFSGVYDVESE